MKIFFSLTALTICLLVSTGCEWTAGSKVNSWDDSSNWVDFSGTYRASDGNSILVRKFGATSGSTNTIWTTNTVSSEYLATGNGTNTAFSGQVAHSPLRGSLTIFTVGGYRFTDSASATADTVALSVIPNDGSAGSFNYLTRAWALTFPSPISAGTQILATYLYISSEQVEDPTQGNSGKPIYSFVIYQTGNRLQLTDNNGATYEGYLGTVRTTGGRVSDATDTSFVPPTSGPVTAQFSATGISQGFKVQIVGTLSGTLTSATTLTSRSIQATFIEEGGSQADIKAYSITQ